jgi:hypothetical protein
MKWHDPLPKAGSQEQGACLINRRNEVSEISPNKSGYAPAPDDRYQHIQPCLMSFKSLLEAVWSSKEIQHQEFKQGGSSCSVASQCDGCPALESEDSPPAVAPWSLKKCLQVPIPSVSQKPSLGPVCLIVGKWGMSMPT